MIKKFNVNKVKQLSKIDKIISLFFKKPINSNRENLCDITDILVIDFSLIGDIIMDIPFLRNIKYNCPNAKIVLVCMPWAKTILEDQKIVDEFIIFDGKNKLSTPLKVAINFMEIISIIKKINKKRYQIGFEPKGDLRHTLFMHYTECDRTITYNYTGGSYLVTDSFEPIEGTKHLIDEKLDLLKLAGFGICQELTIPSLSIGQDMEQFIQKFVEINDLKEKTVIGLHPGASNVNKQYKNYPELVKFIVEYCEENIFFCIFEGNDEEKIVEQVSSVLQKEQYVVVKRSLKEYISLVSVCNYMICNDSAAGHIAAAYDIPVLVIFGPVKDETASPRGGAKVIPISKEYNCKPCTLPTCPLKTEVCINSIEVDEVFNCFKELINPIL